MAQAPKHTSHMKEDAPPRRSQSKRARVRKRVKARYDRHMPDKKHHRIIIWVVFFVCSTVIGAQLLYPPDRALPLTYIGGRAVMGKEHEELAELLNTQFQQTTLTLAVDDATTAEVSLAGAGAELNTEPMIETVINYPFWQRFLPFSILFHSQNITHADVYYTDAILKKISSQQAAALSTASVNASLAIQNGKLVATAEKEGRKVTAEAIYEAIAHSKPALGSNTALAVPAESIPPAETASSLREVQVAAEAALARRVYITAGEHVFAPDEATVASWLRLTTNKAGKATLAVASDVLAKYFDAIDAKAGRKAGQTNINLTDGRETNRTTGRTGKVIQRDELTKHITDWLLTGAGAGEFQATFYDVSPSVIYNNKYTATEAGLRAYVEDAAKRMDVHIAIQQLDGGKWSASVRAGESIPSASTYKLFVAKWLFNEIDKGRVHWNDAMLDTTVSGCFDRMIIASTNPCAESWLAQATRPKFNDYIWGLGFSRGTNFNMPVATHTTAHDLQKMMIGIYDGSIVDGEHRTRLLHSLSIHPYRYGIPTGSQGKVHDKVGFLWDYVHDTAIVKHPRGTYVMTIMTKGQSYAVIANLTREIERIMYP